MVSKIRIVTGKRDEKTWIKLPYDPNIMHDTTVKIYDGATGTTESNFYGEIVAVEEDRCVVVKVIADRELSNSNGYDVNIVFQPNESGEILYGPYKFYTFSENASGYFIDQCYRPNIDFEYVSPGVFKATQLLQLRHPLLSANGPVNASVLVSDRKCEELEFEVTQLSPTSLKLELVYTAPEGDVMMPASMYSAYTATTLSMTVLSDEGYSDAIEAVNILIP